MSGDDSVINKLELQMIKPSYRKHPTGKPQHLSLKEPSIKGAIKTNVYNQE